MFFLKCEELDPFSDMCGNCDFPEGITLWGIGSVFVRASQLQSWTTCWKRVCMSVFSAVYLSCFLLPEESVPTSYACHNFDVPDCTVFWRIGSNVVRMLQIRWSHTFCIRVCVSVFSTAYLLFFKYLPNRFRFCTRMQLASWNVVREAVRSESNWYRVLREQKLLSFISLTFEHLLWIQYGMCPLYSSDIPHAYKTKLKFDKFRSGGL